MTFLCDVGTHMIHAAGIIVGGACFLVLLVVLVLRGRRQRMPSQRASLAFVRHSIHVSTWNDAQSSFSCFFSEASR